MGGKIRHTKLSKTEHPYDLEASGVKWTVWIDENGDLDVRMDAGHTIGVLVTGGQRVTLINYRGD